MPIVWMSPGNSYFKDTEVMVLLSTVFQKYGEMVVFVPDIPAINSYKWMWYDESKARSKAVLKWNNLKNRVNRVAKKLWLDMSKIYIVDWAKGMESNDAYKVYYNQIVSLYTVNSLFHDFCFNTTKEVLLTSWKEFTDSNVEVAVHYLLHEFAFMEYTREYYSVSKVVYIYHKHWPVYEQFITWVFDWVKREYLGFEIVN